MRRAVGWLLAALVFVVASRAHAAPERPNIPTPVAPAAAAGAPSCNPPWEPYTPAKIDRRNQAEESRKAPEEHPTPPPKRWPAADHKRLDVLRGVCAPVYAAERSDDRFVGLGCGTCELLASDAPPLPVKNGGWLGMRRLLGDVHWGSFTRPGADEAVLTFVGCERTVSSDGMITEVGRGLALVGREGRRWQVRRHVGEVGYCQPTKRRDGRDALMCVGWGLDHHHRIKLIDWNAPELPTTVLDLAAPSLTDELCDRPLHRELATLGLTEFHLGDLDGDGINDIRIRAKVKPVATESITAARARPDFALACACIKVMPFSERVSSSPRLRVKNGCHCPQLWNPYTPGTAYDIELRFIETRGRFEPTPETKAALADLRRYHIAAPMVPGDGED